MNKEISLADAKATLSECIWEVESGMENRWLRWLGPKISKISNGLEKPDLRVGLPALPEDGRDLEN